MEDYAKAIYSLEARQGEAASTGDLAARMHVTPASVSAMARRMSGVGLVTHVPYRGIRLTAEGRALALEVLRHHRLLELYLTECLGMSWDRVHEEAEVLEHVLSEELEELIAARLGDPTRDPHGDPIPGRDGRIEESPTRDLRSLGPGEIGIFSRVSDSDPAMLSHLTELGIAPGARVEMLAKGSSGGDVSVSFDGVAHDIGADVAQAMRVEEGR